MASASLRTCTRGTRSENSIVSPVGFLWSSENKLQSRLVLLSVAHTLHSAARANLLELVVQDGPGDQQHESNIAPTHHVGTPRRHWQVEKLEKSPLILPGAWRR